MTQRYLGGIITANPVEPSENFSDSAASGMWTMQEALSFSKAGDWPDPASINPSKFVENIFSTFVYTGTGSSLAINNGIDLSSKGGLVWTKRRNSTNSNWFLDSVRGGSNILRSNTAEGQFTSSGLEITSFNSTGYTLGTASDINSTGGDDVSWTFRKAPKFFDIVTYTGDGSGADRQISHSLGVAPGMIIIKRTSGTNSWYVFHRETTDTDSTNAKVLLLNNTGDFFDIGGFATKAKQTDAYFTVNAAAGSNRTNDNNETYVAYLFAHNDGDGGFGSTGDQDIIKCGSYTGNNSTNAITLGFEPQWILIKNATKANTDWILFDTMRGIVTGGNDTFLFPSSTAQDNATELIELSATGFNLVNSNEHTNEASHTYVYVAIRRGQMKAPTAGTDVFAIDSLDGTPLPSWDSGFPVDMALMRYNIDQSDDTQIASRLLSGRQLLTSTNAAESSNSLHTFDFMAGWGSRTSTTANWYSWMFRRAPSFFDVVAYAGTGSTHNINHNLGVAPEMILLKNRTSSGGGAGWLVGVASLGNDEGSLNGDNGFVAYNLITTYSTTTFTAASGDEQINKSGENYIAYLFATLAGVSKVGTYSGTGSDVNVDCGFTSGARFVLAKRTDSGSSGWYIWDSTRGIVSGNDPYIQLNSSSAEVTNTDYIDPLSSGFTITSNAGSDLNHNGGSYVFLAIA